MSIKTIILSGGSGTRLWPMSRESLPKQFIPLIEEQSLLDLTIRRVSSLGELTVVANEDHRFLVQEIVHRNFQLNEKTPKIILEPAIRNTAPAMAMAALMPGVSSEDLLLFLPSDHFVPDIEEFLATIRAGVLAANSGYIVTFGVKPNFPSTAYGYIKKGTQLIQAAHDNQSIFFVDRFVEKPNFDRAQQMLFSENYLWNAGIFLCKASVLINALLKHAPDILTSCQAAVKDIRVDGNFLRPNKEAFLACRSESIDYAVMEHFDNVVVVPLNCVWSDVGSWNAVANLSSADEFGNRIDGQGFVFESTNTYINAPHRPVVALGVADLVIVDTPDAVLVASAGKTEKVKEVVAELKKIAISQAVMHRRIARPWGWYDSIDVGDRFQVKRITVKPGASLSLQMHHHRSEHWIVVKGTAKVTNGDKTLLLEENQSTYIPIGAKHRLENPEKSDLEMIEVQSGEYLGEDDIVRFEDTYGRS